EATSVKQLADAGVRVGDTLRISGTGMCNIRTSGTWSAKTNSPFLPFDCSQIIWNDARSLPLPESELVNKATALTEAVNRQLHPKPEDESRVSASLRSAIQKSGMVLLDDFGDIVLKTADLCSAKDDCVRLKNALVNLGNSKDWDALVKRANAGKLDGVNVLLRPVSAESLDNLVATSTAPFITHETARAAQSLNSPAPGGFLIVSDEGSDFVDQPWPSASLYDYPPQEQWNAFQKLAQMLMHTPFNAEGIVTKIFTDANGTQHIGLHPIPDRSGLWRYLSTTLLLLTMLGSAIYNGVQAWRRYQRHRTRMMKIQAYYESCLNPQLITPSESLIE
ncbi:TPA: intracellular growth attenuator family protein, partial [Escherichia coli]|nr:intracellular growth attenuator family protein [Escherichia coli]